MTHHSPQERVHPTLKGLPAPREWKITIIISITDRATHPAHRRLPAGREWIMTIVINIVSLSRLFLYLDRSNMHTTTTTGVSTTVHSAYPTMNAPRTPTRSYRLVVQERAFRLHYFLRGHFFQGFFSPSIDEDARPETESVKPCPRELCSVVVRLETAAPFPR